MRLIVDRTFSVKHAKPSSRSTNEDGVASILPKYAVDMRKFAKLCSTSAGFAFHALLALASNSAAKRQACVGNGRRLLIFVVGGGTGRRPSCSRLTLKKKKKKKYHRTLAAHVCAPRRIVKKKKKLRCTPHTRNSKTSVAVALHLSRSTRNFLVLRALTKKER
jgi:hypothetical protein